MDDKPIKANQYSIPEEFASLEEAGNFWDAHSTADYEDIFEPVDEVEINLPPRRAQRVVLASELAARLQQIARQQGVSTETLANLWLQERVTAYSQSEIANQR